MSEMETWVGILSEIKFPKEYSYEEQVEYLIKKGHDFEDIEDGYDCAWSDTVKHLNGKWYLWDGKEVRDCQKLVKKGPGAYKAVVSFYNGGACLDEVLERLLKKEESDG